MDSRLIASPRSGGRSRGYRWVVSRPYHLGVAISVVWTSRKTNLINRPILTASQSS